ncbi:MAG: TetR/AcrR family transcriptional regulator [Nitrospirota bacterium]
MHKPQSTVKRSVGRRPKSSGVDEDTRADILAAARKVFALRGFAGTSVREVAEAARVNKAMIYYHFKDKVDLYRAVLSDSFDAMQDIWKHKIFQGEATARRKIQQYIEGFIRFQHDNEDLRKILAMEFSTTGTKSENLKWIAKHYFAENHAALMKILEAGMKSGELKKMNPLMAVVALIGMIIHSFIYIPISPYIQKKSVDMSSKKLGAFVSQIFFSGLSAPNNARNQKYKAEVRA